MEGEGGVCGILGGVSGESPSVPLFDPPLCLFPTDAAAGSLRLPLVGVRVP